MQSNKETNKENGNWIHPRAALITGIVLAAAALRIVPHPMNFAPIGALALFGGAYFSSKRAAVAVPLLSLVAGDIFTGFHRLIPYVYASFLVSVAIGFWLRRKKSASRIGGATVAGAIQFFLVTNFALWASSIGSYPKNCGRLGRVLYRGPATILEHAGGRRVLCRVAVRRHGPGGEAVPVAAGTARR